MLVRVLGAAAGGGFPQWNCNCHGCKRARLNDPEVKPRTQASVAVSADGKRWVLLNASPDLPFQINSSPCLQPEAGDAARHSPIRAVVISGGDIDCIAGLLSLRESQRFCIYTDDFVRRILAENSVFRVLNEKFVTFQQLDTSSHTELHDADGNSLGLSVEAFRVGGKIPLYQETSNDIAKLSSQDAVIGLGITSATGKRFYFIPGCNAVTDDIRNRIEGADLLFFDGTLWQDDEMILAGMGTKTGQRMGHLSISGTNGSIACLASTKLQKRIFIHINNTNPVLCDDSPQAAFVRAHGWDIAYDGMEVSL